MQDAEHKTSRVFFALWPDDAVRSQLDAAAAQLHKVCGGRRTRAESIHLTLVFLGEVECERLDELRAAAARVKGAAFVFRLTRLGGWTHNRIAWAAPDAPPQPMVQLVAGLQTEIESAGFKFDGRHFLPHVTLLRKVDCHEIIPLEAIEWQAGEFVLVRSVATERSSSYEVIGRWQMASQVDNLFQMPG